MKPLFILIGAVVSVGAIVLALTSEPAKEASKMDETVKRTYDKFPGVLPDEQLKNRTVTIKTAKGELVIELFGTEAPKTVSNFIFLAENKFYNGLTFHRREEDFVIQGGDPNGDGTGGPGYDFEDEAVTRNYDRGVVAMANSGSDTNGSQFFIMLADNPNLPRNYTIFGKVTSGLEVVDKIQVGDVMTEVSVN
ncbi:MAG: peptidylprolyl isomerase [bacterium]|nr:peptidylprolyl isomerase [bacterium]